jgi:hypothetical protein
MSVNMDEPMPDLGGRGVIPLPVLDCTPLFSGAPLDEPSAAKLAAL